MNTLNEVKAMVELALQAARIDGVKVEISDAAPSERWDVPQGTVTFGDFEIWPDLLCLDYLRLGWKLSRNVVVPGVRYYRDGSGKPDSSDVIDIAYDESAWVLVKRAVLCWIDEALDNAALDKALCAEADEIAAAREAE